MDANTMLDILSVHGHDAGSDFNDSDEVTGWFGWAITDPAEGPPVLTVHYEAATRTPGEPQTITRRWRLIEEPTSG
jgi:hypothetical protein